MLRMLIRSRPLKVAQGMLDKAAATPLNAAQGMPNAAQGMPNAAQGTLQPAGQLAEGAAMGRMRQMWEEGARRKHMAICKHTEDRRGRTKARMARYVDAFLMRHWRRLGALGCAGRRWRHWPLRGRWWRRGA